MLVQNLQADRLVIKYLGFWRNQELQARGVPRLLLILKIFSSKKWTNLLARSTAEELEGKKFICFPVKKTSNCAKQGFAVTFSWIDKARIVIHFWFENGVLYNSALVGIRLIIGSKSGTTPSPFKPTTDHFLLLDFLTVPRGTRPSSDDSFT